MPLLKVCKAVFCFEICSASALYSHPETSLAQLRLYFSPVFNTFLSTSPHYSIVHITYVSYTAQKAEFSLATVQVLLVFFFLFFVANFPLLANDCMLLQYFVMRVN